MTSTIIIIIIIITLESFVDISSSLHEKVFFSQFFLHYFSFLFSPALSMKLGHQYVAVSPFYCFIMLHYLRPRGFSQPMSASHVIMPDFK